MAYRSLELTLISAKDLKDVNVFSKMDVYAVASIAGDHGSQRTPTDKDGGKSPSWNATLRFTVPADPAAASRLVLHVLLRSERALGDRDIGEVHVPLKELLDAGGFARRKQFVSYQVRKPSSGKAKGVLNLSYKFLDSPASEKAPAAPAPAPMHYPDPAKLVPPPPVAYPAPPPAGYPPISEKEADKPVTAYPAAAGPSSGYPPPGSSYPPAAPSGPYPPGGYPPYPPQQSYYGPPPPAGYGYPPQPSAYGYPPPPQAGYGYGAVPATKPQKKKSGFGTGLGAGLLGGALGGLLIGDMMSDASSYDAGYDAGFDDGGGFDF